MPMMPKNNTEPQKWNLTSITACSYRRAKKKK